MWCERPPGERRGKRGNRPETSCTHLHCIQAVQAKVVNKVSRCCDLLGVHLLKVFQHAKHTLGHLLAVQEGLRWKPEAVGNFKGCPRGERQGRRGWSQRRIEREGGQAQMTAGSKAGCGVGWVSGGGVHVPPDGFLLATHLDGGGTSGGCGKGTRESTGDGYITTRHGQAGATEKGVGKHGKVCPVSLAPQFAPNSPNIFGALPRSTSPSSLHPHQLQCSPPLQSNTCKWHQ